MAAEKSRILIIGGTGYIGRYVVGASARLGHRTFALVRDTAPADPAKAQLLQGFTDSGVTLLKGDLYDHASLVNAIKNVDVVISTVGFFQLADQTKIIAAIKEAGNIKRFLPSEFGNDVDRTNAVEPAKSAFAIKVQIRRAIEAEKVPYTYVSSNFFAGYFLPTLGQAGATGLPTDKVTILGDGNTKAIFVDENDIGTYTIKAADDPRTLNKTLYLRPPANILTHNELVSLWEKKVGKTFERVYVPEEEVLKQIQEAPIPLNVALAISHSVFVKGDHTNFEIEPSFGVEASELYPDVKYTTVDEYLNRFL
ncbi:isoflavone reductase-like protein isoform X1 [Ananas comosus]|uniref:Isoflavone reductase-like protein n=1 Tax=Ananas comosus TaxID=4615 RepID=A0A199W9A4_ANACO|nr:isoflavone reductase-like protein isoform X1 [Ananas comosus]OAY85818.1 Isoflavone reductase-like protein [Ananas comosus]